MDDDDSDLDPTLQNIKTVCGMQSTLNKFHKEKFKEKEDDMQEEFLELKECDGYKEYFNLKAAQVNELQNIVKSSLGVKLTGGDEMALYKSRFD